MDQKYLDMCHNRLEFNLSVICEIVPDGAPPLCVSDQNQYVNHKFFSARLKPPSVSRSLGEYLKPNLSFPEVSLQINNADGWVNPWLPGGEYGGSLSGAKVKVSIGHGEIQENWHPLFTGFVRREKGVRRDPDKVTMTVRDASDAIDMKFPEKMFSKAEFPNLPENLAGKHIPMVFGDFTVFSDKPLIPGVIVNGASENPGTVEVIVSLNDQAFIDAENIWLARGDGRHLIDRNDITVSPGNRAFRVVTNGATIINTESEQKNYTHENQDWFLVSVKTRHQNATEIAGELVALAPVATDASWQQSGTAPARAYIYQQKTLLTYILSLLESDMREACFNADGIFRVVSNRWETFSTGSERPLDQWDFEKDSVKLGEQDRPVNRAQVFYDFSPELKKTVSLTGFLQHDEAVRRHGKISAQIELPYFYRDDDATAFLRDTLRITGSWREYLEANLSLRSLKLEPGDWVNVSLEDDAITLTEAPMRVVSVGFSDYKIRVKFCSFQMVPFTGYAPDFPTNGGYLAQVSKSPEDIFYSRKKEQQ